MGSQSERRCFVCAEPLGHPDAVAIREQGRRTAQAVTVRFHQACAPCLAVAILECLDPIRIRSPLASAGGLRPRARADAGLTSRQREILQRLVTGETNRQIAHQLGVSEKTIKNMVSVLLSKLEVQSRTEAAVVALQTGLIDHEPTD